MKTNNGFDIVPYIISIGLAIAIMIQTVYLYKVEIRYVQTREVINDLTFVVSALTDDVVELRSELDEHIEEEESVVEETEPKQDVVQTNANYDYNYVLRVVAAESRGESIEGQMAVAQCIRETSKATGMTPEQVVKQKNQYASPVAASVVTDSIKEACDRVIIHGASVTDEPIRYFYSTAGGFVSPWHENNLIYVMTIGNHRFFKAK